MSTPNSSNPLDRFFEKLDCNNNHEDGETSTTTTTTTTELAFNESNFQKLITTQTDVGSSSALLMSSFVAYVNDNGDGALWIINKAVNEESCCLILKGSDEPSSLPSDFDYSLDLIIVKTTTTISSSADDDTTNQASSTKLQLIAKNADSVSSTLQGLLLLCVFSSSPSSSDDDSTSKIEYDVTIKAFATNPRQPFPTLLRESFLIKQCKKSNSSNNNNNGYLSSLKLHFVTVDESTCQTLLTCSNLNHIEFRQCTLVENLFIMNVSNDNDESNINNNNADNDDGGGGPKRMTISCTMPEFGKIASSLGGGGGGDNNNSNKTTIIMIEELDLQLHFWLQGPIFDSFINALKTNLSLRKLSLEYLDINDDGWIQLCECLHNHPNLRILNLGFTEKFVDTFRKLTPERRQARTKAILELLQVNTNIIELDFPEFQQDIDIMIQVNECLEKNKKEQQYKVGG